MIVRLLVVLHQIRSPNVCVWVPTPLPPHSQYLADLRGGPMGDDGQPEEIRRSETLPSDVRSQPGSPGATDQAEPVSPTRERQSPDVKDERE